RHGRPAGFPLRMGFTPEAPRYFTLAYKLSLRMGIAIVPVADADVVFHWADRTVCEEPPPDLEPRAVNRDVRDISKAHVSVLHQQVFGYDLEPDPGATELVEKSDENARHDGRVVTRPTGTPGLVVERLIDNRLDDAIVRDHRVAVSNGQIGMCAARYRAVEDRFLSGHRNLYAALHAPDAYFTKAEQAAMVEMVRAIGADWAELDVLRDRASGRLYVVDVNPTPSGPVSALGSADLAAYWRQQEASFAGLLQAHARLSG
ncbi:MAG TPA: hypothetical protein VMH24_00160, partial [Candidatus Sulfotelmatobacter sp.]|nr:hypothetical protein [Candidatus Sulfotelmatobacter sp.]